MRTRFILNALAIAVVAVVMLALGALHTGPDGLVVSGLLFAGAIGAIMDERTEFADAASVANSTGTYLIGDVIPLTTARDLGNGRPVYLVISVDTEIITGGSAGTIVFKLVSDAQAAIATDGSATEHFVSRSFVTDDSAANDTAMNAGEFPVVVALPLEGPAYEAYLGVLYVIGTTTTTAGKINAYLTLDPPVWKSYADGI